MPSDGIRSRRLICVGQVSVDTVVTLSGPIPLGDQAVGPFTTLPGGTAAVVAHNAAALGANPLFVGHIGQSQDDADALERLTFVGVQIDTTIVTEVGLRVVVVVEPDGKRTMFSNGNFADFTNLAFRFQRNDIAYFEGWHLFDSKSAKGYANLIRRAHAAGATVALDICSATRADDAQTFVAMLNSLPVDILLANEAEDATYELQSKATSDMLVVHRGPRSTILRTGSGKLSVPVTAVEAHDTTGAGDTFAAGFLVALARGSDPLECARHGNLAAMAVLGIPGGLLPATRRPLPAEAILVGFPVREPERSLQRGSAQTILVESQAGALTISPDDRSNEELLLNGFDYEPQETALMRTIVTPGSTVLDIGANIGYFSLIASQAAGQAGVVHAIEPDEANRQLLLENIERNRADNVFVHAMAFANSTSPRPLYISETNLGRHSFARRNVPNLKAVRRPATSTIDRFLLRFKPAEASDIVLKIDVEGAEGLVLQGARATLKRPEVSVWMELWPNGLDAMGSNPQKLLRSLKPLGLYAALYNDRELVPMTLDQVLCHVKERRSNLFYLLLTHQVKVVDAACEAVAAHPPMRLHRARLNGGNFQHILDVQSAI